MRIIKFRGKRIDNGAWEYGDLIENQGRNFIYHATSKTTLEDNDDGRITITAIEVDPATVGQYTGLKDKNGKEIYEDDILLDESGAYGVVWYSMGCFCVDFGEGFDLQYFTDRIHEICYVAGNVHDNPELLKGGDR